jgi:hypothetical protein
LDAILPKEKHFFDSNSSVQFSEQEIARICSELRKSAYFPEHAGGINLAGPTAEGESIGWSRDRGTNKIRSDEKRIVARTEFANGSACDQREKGIEVRSKKVRARFSCIGGRIRALTGELMYSSSILSDE